MSETAVYKCKRYPKFPHNGKTCTVVSRKPTIIAGNEYRAMTNQALICEAYVLFEGDPRFYIANVGTDLEGISVVLPKK